MRMRTFRLGLLLSCFIMEHVLSTVVYGDGGKGRSYYEARGEIVWEVHTKEKVIALTFDDGPNPTITPQILDLLKQYDAKATFFTVGVRVEKYPDIVRREVQEGHEVANHTYHHCYFKSNTTVHQMNQEIVKTDEIIVSITGQKPHLFRPPGGFYNETAVNASLQSGRLMVLWSWHQDTKDWSRPGVRKIIDKVLKNARNGDIVLLHDHVEGSSQTVEALKLILPELQKRGYRFVTVSEMLKMKYVQS